MKPLALTILIGTILASCTALTGEEVARIPVNEVSTEENLVIKETTLPLKKGDEIALWSDMDIEYEGELSMGFEVKVFKGDSITTSLRINPAEKNITLGEIKTSFNNKTSWSFFGKNGEMVIDEDGDYTFKAIFLTSPNETLKINKAELVLKK